MQCWQCATAQSAQLSQFTNSSAASVSIFCSTIHRCAASHFLFFNAARRSLRRDLSMPRHSLLVGALLAATLVVANGCRSCSSCHDYDPPVANCQCGHCPQCGCHGGSACGCSGGSACGCNGGSCDSGRYCDRRRLHTGRRSRRGCPGRRPNGFAAQRAAAIWNAYPTAGKF